MIKIIWSNGDEQLFPCKISELKGIFEKFGSFERACMEFEDSYVRLKYAREIIDMDHLDNQDD